MSVRFLADENFDSDIVNGIRLRSPGVDIVRAQDVGLSATEDPTVLEWAARERRVLLTHDLRTMLGFAYNRIRGGQSLAGVFAVRQGVSAVAIIDDILLVDGASLEGEWEGQVQYLPL